jgi:hypothetical protein
MKGKICLEVYRKDENWTVGYSSRDEFARIIIKKEDEIYAVMDNCESFVELYGREKIHQVLIMSPGRTNMIKISQTDRIMKIYLPLWIDDELRSYCKNVNKNYEDLNKKEIPKKIITRHRDIFRILKIPNSHITYRGIFGNLLRFLVKDDQIELEETLRNMMSNEFVTNINSLATRNSPYFYLHNHHLFQMEVDEDLKNYKTVLTGKNVISGLRKTMRELETSNILNIYESLENKNQYNFMRGGFYEILFERFIRYDQLKDAGLLCKIKKDEDDFKIDGKWFKMSNCLKDLRGHIKRENLKKLGTITLSENTLYCQDKENWPTIDFLFLKEEDRDVYIFGIEATVSKNHSISSEGIKKIIKIAENISGVRMYVHLFYHLHIFFFLFPFLSLILLPLILSFTYFFFSHIYI